SPVMKFRYSEKRSAGARVNISSGLVSDNEMIWGLWSATDHCLAASQRPDLGLTPPSSLPHISALSAHSGAANRALVGGRQPAERMTTSMQSPQGPWTPSGGVLGNQLG